jgi:predicted esterase
MGGGSGTTSCQALQWQSRCACAGKNQPVDLPASGRKVPAYLSHSSDDDMVSVYYACALADQWRSLGVPHQVRILNRAGGHIVGDFLLDAWSFLKSQSL